MPRLPSFALALLLGVIASVGLQATALAAPTPTPEQIEQFKQLPADQQQALAKQFGVDMATVKAATGGASAPTAEQAPPPPIAPSAPAPRAASAPDLNAPVETIAKAAAPDAAKLAEPQAAQGKSKKLEPFGYSLFAGTPSTFAPATDIPVPLNYVIGPGDTVMVQLYGKQNANYELEVDREGIIRFPELGPISAAGQSFDEFKQQLQVTIQEKMIGVKASITMGPLRSIRVFVMGEAYRPGSYTVSSLSTITNALFASGGITPIGSLRKIDLKRKGETITTIDLYDLLLRGNTENDARLQPGDVIFVPPLGKTAGVGGEVRRPAIYELKNESRFEELVTLAGGALPTAYPQGSRVERIDAKGNRTVVDVALGGKAKRPLSPRDGDVLTVASILEKMENIVLLSGHVHRPGGYQWQAGMRISDLVKGMPALLPEPDLRYALIKREIQPTRTIEVVPVNLQDAFARPDSVADVPLRNRDEVVVFGRYDTQRMSGITTLVNALKAQTAYNEPARIVTVAGNVRFAGEYPLTPGMRLSTLADVADLGAQTDLDYALIRRELQPSRDIEVIPVSLRPGQTTEADPALQAQDTVMVFSLAKDDRSALITPLLDQLQRQSGPGNPTRIVSVSGDVKFNGSYPLTPYMHVSDLVSAAGGFTESAYGVDAEVSRTVISDAQVNTYNRIKVEFGANSPRVTDENLLLISRDQLYIKRVPNWEKQEFAEVLGEVNFPGRYPVYKGDTLKELVARAGGLTEHADANAAVFLRGELRKREQEQLDRMRDQLQRDIAAMQIDMAKQKAAGLESQAVGQNLLQQVTAAKATGRLSIDLPRLLEGQEDTPILLRNGDQLVIPRPSAEITVLGEVQYPSSHLYHAKHDVDDYIDLAGGMTGRSDDDRVYVIKANGTIVPADDVGGLWASQQLSRGDTIVVPYDVYEVSPLTYWTTVSQILFNISTTVAALKTVGVYQ